MPQAARLGDPIGHTPSMSSSANGASAGAALSLAGAAASGAGGGEVSGKIIGPCSGNVFTNGIPAARAQVDMALCSKHPSAPLAIATGSPTVFINGMPAARVSDKIACAAFIVEGSGNVFIGGGSVRTGLINPGGLFVPVTQSDWSMLADMPAVPEENKPGGAGRAAATAKASSGPAKPVATGSDLAMRPRPIDAPKKINLSPLQTTFDSLWGRSFPNGRSKEQGGVLVTDPAGKIGIVNSDGNSGTSGTFRPDFNVPAGVTIVGVMHTHPYDSKEGGYTGVSLSGGDVGNLVNDPKRKVSIAQSGNEQFMMLKTGATPTAVDSAAMNTATNARINALVADSGMSFSAASKQAARENAQKMGLAYYEGRNGVFKRVGP